MFMRRIPEENDQLEIRKYLSSIVATGFLREDGSLRPSVKPTRQRTKFDMFVNKRYLVVSELARKYASYMQR